MRAGPVRGEHCGRPKGTSPPRALDVRERVQQKICVVVEEAVAAAGLAPRVANAVWDTSF